MKRVGAAIGEGAAAVASIHKYLAADASAYAGPGSSRLVRVKDIVLVLDRDVARVSAVGQARIGLEACRRRTVLEQRVAPPAALGEPSAVLHHDRVWVKTSGTSTSNGASVLFLGFHCNLTIFEPSGNGRHRCPALRP